MCSRVKRGSTMPLLGKRGGSVLRVTSNQVESPLTSVAHVVGGPYRRRSPYFWPLPCHLHSSLETPDGYAAAHRSQNQSTGQLCSWYHFHVFTLDRRSSISTLHTSLYLTTSQAWLPSQSSTLETGSVARSLAYSTGGSAAAGRAKGNFGGTEKDEQKIFSD